MDCGLWSGFAFLLRLRIPDRELGWFIRRTAAEIRTSTLVQYFCQEKK